ncbi:MAG: TIM barrel protein [Chloroflexi bacterium]|nr:TIM barrel protein [Chloroflexota bacterium]
MGLERGEFYNFPTDELGPLQREILSLGLQVSIHAPLVRLEWYPDPPTWSFLCDEDKEKRELTLKMIHDTLERAKDFETEHIVVHYPSPPTVSAPWFTYDKQRSIALDSADRLAELSVRYEVPLHVEGFGPSPFLNGEFLTHILKEYPVLRYCFDVAHLHIAAQRDGFDYFELAEALAPCIGSIHLWNTRGWDDYKSYRHIPLHPNQKPEEGWVDIARVLPILRRTNPNATAILEYAPRFPPEWSDYDYLEGVQWIKELLKISS